MNELTRPNQPNRPSERQWVLASTNPGKMREFALLLQPSGVQLRPQSDFGITEADEPHPSFVENALAKARHASRLAGLPGLADDSGLCVPALGGAPGVYSARYAALLDGNDPTQLDRALLAQGRAAIDAANNRKLVAALASLAPESRVAWYYCSLAWVAHPLDPCPLLAEGLWAGRIVAQRRGDGGFGYDPHFLIEGEDLTAAELPPERKNATSHRARALQRLLAALDERATLVRGVGALGWPGVPSGADQAQLPALTASVGGQPPGARTGSGLA